MSSSSPARRAPPSVWLGVLLALLAPAAGVSQVLTTVEFSFSNPGARSLGLGGAFVALADDATAAFANPAGLIQLTEPEVSVEGRTWSYSTPYTTGGRAAGQPTGIGIDTVGIPLRGESTAELSGLSFISLVYPAHSWSFAFYQHQLMNFEMTQEIQGLFGPGQGPSGTWRGPIERGFFDFEITTLALAAGYRISDRLSLGFGLSHFESESLFVGDEYLPDDDSPDSFFSTATFLPERLSHRVVGEIPEGDWGLAGGFLWSLSRNWKLGGVFREGPRLEAKLELTAGPVHPELAPGTRLEVGSSPWHFPDVYGLGLSYRSPDGHLTASFEWTRVEYSTAIESLADELSDGQTIDDANELRLGGEYAFFAGRSVVAFRLGVWHDPNHQVRDQTGNPFFQAENVPGEDELHIAAGLGIVFDKLQIDLGADVSERRDTASLSAIYSF